jgi:phosphonate transport system substrate-binding protein
MGLCISMMVADMTQLSLPRRWLLIPLLFALFATRAFAADPAPLKLGIMPFNSTLTLIRVHQPLATHLEQALGRKIQILGSTDYFTHVNQLLNGDFDLAITGPHFAVMAAERGYQPLVRYAADLRPSFVVRDDSTIRTAADLRGKRLGMPHRLAIISSSGVKWLDEHGLRIHQDYRTVEFGSHGAAIAAVAAGEVDAALSANTAWGQVPESVRAKTRLLPLDIRMPHVMTLAHSRLPKADIERVRQALHSFGDTPAGQAFFRETGYQGYAEITKADLEKLRPFIDLTVKMMR